LIQTECLTEKPAVDPAIAHLSAQDEDFARIIARIGPCGLAPKSQREPYEGLIRSIAYQQLHARAASAIFGRFLALYPDDAFPSPASILATDEQTIRACGFSTSKVATIRGIAEKMLDGTVPTREAAMALTDEELIKRLVTLRGVGRWTVEMLLIFTLERPDVLPVDDFGVREGWRLLKALDKQPAPKELAKIGEGWSPYRSTASWYLWSAADILRSRQPASAA
jgi:DNA-3-methyladenine glycosylase II